MSVFFDLRRVSTVVCSTGRVHIALSGTGSSWTLCGLDLLKREPLNWRDNLEDRQPNCSRCVTTAVEQPTAYPFVKLVTPPRSVTA